MKFFVDDDEQAFSLSEDTNCFRLKAERSEIGEEHVEEFMDKTVEWLSSNPEKGILIDFAGVKSVCTGFTIALNNYYQNIKSRGLNVRFINVDPIIEPYVDVSNITVVMSIPDKPVLSAKELLADLSQNLTNRQLMEKYGLSRKGLASMFRKLLYKGLISKQALARRLGVETCEVTDLIDGGGQRKITIDAAEVLQDLADNISNSDLMRKYKLSEKGLKSLFSKLYRKGLISKTSLIRRSRPEKKSVSVGSPR